MERVRAVSSSSPSRPPIFSADTVSSRLGDDLIDGGSGLLGVPGTDGYLAPKPFGILIEQEEKGAVEAYGVSRRHTGEYDLQGGVEVARPLHQVEDPQQKAYVPVPLLEVLVAGPEVPDETQEMAARLV